MAYEWADETTDYVTTQMDFTIGNGSVVLNITAHSSSESTTPAQAAEIIGQIKDACEGAGLTFLGGFTLRGGAIQTLQEA